MFTTTTKKRGHQILFDVFIETMRCAIIQSINKFQYENSNYKIFVIFCFCFHQVALIRLRVIVFVLCEYLNQTIERRNTE